ncbi:nitroreductase family protein [Mycobacterium sp. SMC-4]|uniref:nitroreductase family protein n=1 Tax=Mycobacterium sp. SMC-4 TaxID=2857059 RepID=UPI0021B42C93|nr:nitroreductase family protein [Mycobacterium sp. SMC-4]UXA18310.1 nitroreductase family protein [Mycobacterium sp. SMC-4]
MATAFPDTAVLESVLDLAAYAPSARNAQPWQWYVDEHSVQLFADWERRLGDSEADRRDVLLGCGAVLHHCAVALAAAGWASRIQRFPDDDGMLARVALDPRPAGNGSRDLAGAISRRRSDRRPFGGALPAGTLELLVIRAERFGVELAVVPSIRWARVDADRFALSYGDRPPDRADDDAVMLVLATGTDTDVMRLRAGEALSDLTLAAAALGLASCPLTDPLREQRNRLALACEVFDGEAHPQALIRIGSAISGDPIPPVPRRSVAETTTFHLN